MFKKICSFSLFLLKIDISYPSVRAVWDFRFLSARQTSHPNHEPIDFRETNFLRRAGGGHLRSACWIALGLAVAAGDGGDLEKAPPGAFALRRDMVAIVSLACETEAALRRVPVLGDHEGQSPDI